MTGATQTMESNNEALVAEMLRDAKKIEMPSPNSVVHKGDEALPAPMVLSELASAGYIPLWDTRTFEVIPVLSYMVIQKLKQRRKDGSYRFTATDPQKEPKHGQVKCLLHPDDPNRGHYDELNLPICSKSNIKNKYELTIHMKRKHKQSWEAIEDERIKAEKADDRKFQRSIVEMATKVNKEPSKRGRKAK